MYVPELVKPGFWLDGLADEVDRDVSSLCDLMIECMTGAALALALFEPALAGSWAWADGTPEDRDEARQREREAVESRKQELAVEHPPPSMVDDTEAWIAWDHELGEKAERDVLRAQWERGQLPEEYLSALPKLYARTFVRELARLVRALRTLAELDTGAAKAAIEGARDDLARRLPPVVDVRDSIDHAEDRVRQLDRRGRPLDLQPVEVPGAISAPGGVFVGTSLIGNCYGTTVADGSHAQVEVSPETLDIAREVVQVVLDALPWRESWSPVPHREWSPRR